MATHSSFLNKSYANVRTNNIIVKKKIIFDVHNQIYVEEETGELNIKGRTVFDSNVTVDKDKTLSVNEFYISGGNTVLVLSSPGNYEVGDFLDIENSDALVNGKYEIFELTNNLSEIIIEGVIIYDEDGTNKGDVIVKTSDDVGLNITDSSFIGIRDERFVYENKGIIGDIEADKLYVNEIYSSTDTTVCFFNIIDMKTKRIVNLGDPIYGKDAVNKRTLTDSISVIGENKEIPIDGVNPTLIHDVLFGSFHIIVKSQEFYPTATFFISKNDRTKESNGNRLSFSKGYPNTYINIVWPENSGILMVKSNGDYNGNYEVKIY